MIKAPHKKKKKKKTEYNTTEYNTHNVQQKQSQKTQESNIYQLLQRQRNRWYTRRPDFVTHACGTSLYPLLH